MAGVPWRLDFLFASFSCVKTRKGRKRNGESFPDTWPGLWEGRCPSTPPSFLPLMEEKKQKKIKAPGVPRSLPGTRRTKKCRAHAGEPHMHPAQQLNNSTIQQLNKCRAHAGEPHMYPAQQFNNSTTQQLNAPKALTTQHQFTTTLSARLPVRTTYMPAGSATDDVPAGAVKPRRSVPSKE